MSHNIFGNRFLGYRRPAWHEIGTVINESTGPVDPSEGVKMIDADFEIVKAPCKIEVSTVFGTFMKDDPGRFAIVREPTEDTPDFAIFGHCGPDYEIVQRRDFARALDKLSKRWPLETIGVLGLGETVFFSLDAGDMDIHGEQVHQYFLVTDTVDGKTAARIAFTPVRVVCQNTLVTGLRQATITASLDHRNDFENSFNFRVDLVDKMAASQRDVMMALELLADTQISDEQADAVFAAAFPYPVMPKKMELATVISEEDKALEALRLQGVRAADSYKYYCDRADTMRNGCRWLYGKFNDEHQPVARTAWAAYNAVTECSDWRDGADSVPVSTLFGKRAIEKRNAFDAAIAFCK